MAETVIVSIASVKDVLGDMADRSIVFVASETEVLCDRARTVLVFIASMDEGLAAVSLAVGSPACVCVRSGVGLREAVACAQMASR